MIGREKKKRGKRERKGGPNGNNRYKKKRNVKKTEHLSLTGFIVNKKLESGGKVKKRGGGFWHSWEAHLYLTKGENLGKPKTKAYRNWSWHRGD